jgi:hypothetical protein
MEKKTLQKIISTSLLTFIPGSTGYLVHKDNKNKHKYDLGTPMLNMVEELIKTITPVALGFGNALLSTQSYVFLIETHTKKDIFSQIPTVSPVESYVVFGITYGLLLFANSLYSDIYVNSFRKKL